jgi:RNA polymerase sigma factor (sigma-70 family)
MIKSMAITFPDGNENFRERTGKDFTFFYEKYYPKLIYYTNKLCQNTQKAEDLTTEAFIIAFQKVDKYDIEKAQFSTWLFTIARNLTLQDLKTSKKTISMDVKVDEDGTTMKDFLQEEESLEYLHDISVDKAKIMKEHISKLKEPYKKVIEMREIKQMAYKDIAAELDKNLSTIKSQIRNGRKLLKDSTAKEFEILDEMFL